MNKHEFITQLAAKTGLKKTECIALLDAQESVVLDTVAAGGEIFIPGICKIMVIHKPERTNTNPRTLEPVLTPAHSAPKIKALKALKDATKLAVI